MNRTRPSPRAARPAAVRGFTLVELMIAVVIAAVLAVVAVPTFLDTMRKSRRADAFAALSVLQQAQERFRSSNATYAGNSALTSGLGLSATTASGYYAIAIGTATATGYTATATGRNGTSQANDGNCRVLGVQMAGGNLSYGASPNATIDWTDPNRCWAR